MPELPDVERMKEYLQHTVAQKKIVEVSVEEQQVLSGVSSQRLRDTLRQKTFGKVLRHGKYCFLPTDEKTLVLHFGMTGEVSYFKLDESKPEHICLSIIFENDYTLAYTSTRKLGEIELCEDSQAYIEDNELGPDALSPDLDERQFVNIFADRRGMLKSALMNQHYLAGIGNVYSDEILYQDGLHPKTKISQLDEGDLGRVFSTMREVLEKSVAAQGKPEELPDSYLTSHRNGDGKCPACRQELEKMAVAGRNACYCPACQTKTSLSDG